MPLRPDRDWFNHCDILFFSVCDCDSNNEEEGDSGNVLIRELDCDGAVDIKDDDIGGDGDANVEFWEMMEDTLEDIAYLNQYLSCYVCYRLLCMRFAILVLVFLRC